MEVEVIDLRREGGQLVLGGDPSRRGVGGGKRRPGAYRKESG